ncbi:MAG: hypothetical protein R3C41_07230 [Calditrichia bacterium]|nr:hypothetical protein [Calditrichota bacterium]MCB0266858.1 hypothetical protein [Calditrichota bacterium]MCB9066758.1 hypothetical protein [Calditrichia bacterium]
MPFLRMQESQVYYYNSNRSLPNKTAEFRGFLQPENSVGNVAKKTPFPTVEFLHWK